MLRKILSAGGVGVLALSGAMLAGPASAATGGTLCQLSGTANFSPGLTATPGQYTYTFSGTLSGCQSSTAGAPTGGTIAASSNAFQSGGCAYALNGSGTATVTWNDSATDTSTITYTTNAAAAGVVVTGSVASGRYAGQSVGGLLVFQTQTPQNCTAPGGLASATFSGVTTVGSPS
jgi:hypothetical protein